MRYGAEEHWRWILSTRELAVVRAVLLSADRVNGNGRGDRWVRTLRQLGYLLPPRLRPLVRELVFTRADPPPRVVALGPRLTEQRRVARLQDVCARRLRRLGGLPAEADSVAERAFLARTLATIDPVHDPVLRRVGLPSDLGLADVLELPDDAARRPGLAA